MVELLLCKKNLKSFVGLDEKNQAPHPIEPIGLNCSQLRQFRIPKTINSFQLVFCLHFSSLLLNLGPDDGVLFRPGQTNRKSALNFKF